VGKHQSSYLAWLLAVLALLVIMGTTPSYAGVSRLYPPTAKQVGILRLAQVQYIGTRQEIVKMGEQYQALLASGIPDSTLRDSSIAIGRTYCCGGPDFGSIWFYVPMGTRLAIGDIVEIKMGRQASKTRIGVINSLRQIREMHGAVNPSCRWDPPNEHLWRRVLYCDWMKAEGWTLMKGAWPTWFSRDSTVVNP
jgi:hypothetical protein